MKRADAFLPQPLQDYFSFDKPTKVVFRELLRWLQPHVDVLARQTHPIRELLVASWASKASSSIEELERLIASARNVNRGSMAREALLRASSELRARGELLPRPLQMYFRSCLETQHKPSKDLHSRTERNHMAVSAMWWLILHRGFNPTRNPGKFDIESAASLVARAMTILGVRHLGEDNIQHLWEEDRRRDADSAQPRVSRVLPFRQN